MNLGISAFAWTANFNLTHLNLLPKVRALGFTGFEIPMFDPADLPVKAIREALRANDLESTVCAILPVGINPISPDAAMRKHAIAHLIECIETAAEIGAHLLGGPLFAPIGYLPGHRPLQEEQRWAVEVFRSLAYSLEENAMTLSLEPVNRAETFFIRTASDAKKLCSDVSNPRIGVTIDTFHANIEEKSISEAIESLGPYLKHLHLSENDRGLLGSGHIDFVSIFKALHKIEYTGYLMIEGFGHLPNELFAPGALWAELNVSPEDIASKGIAFLRRLIKDYFRAPVL